jgi:hypothetical protein
LIRRVDKPEREVGCHAAITHLEARDMQVTADELARELFFRVWIWKDVEAAEASLPSLPPARLQNDESCLCSPNLGEL